MGKVYKDGIRVCDSCFKAPYERGMRRFGTCLYKGIRYYLCPVCRKVLKKTKETA